MASPDTQSTLPPRALEAEAAVQCPLCEYDLRGLVEPRCPECGYAFDWAELRDPARRVHPYLFEHHPERNVRSFLRTAIGHLKPRRFWGGLLPSQPSKPRRLFVYAMVIIAMSVLPPALYLGWEVTEAWMTIERQQRQFAAFLATSRGAAWAQQQYPGRSIAQIARSAPRGSLLLMLTQRQFVVMVKRAAMVQVVPLMWVAFTLVALSIFQISLHRARMRQVHLVRCIIYCADVFLWSQALISLMLIAFIGRSIAWDGAGQRILWQEQEIILAASAWATIAMLLVFAYRLIIAFKKYLRFDHPISTILASQFIVLLAVLIVLTNV